MRKKQGPPARLNQNQKQEFMVAWAPMNWDYEFGKEYLETRVLATPARSTIYVLRKELMKAWETEKLDIDQAANWHDFATLNRHNLGVSVKLATLRQMFDELERGRDEQSGDDFLWRAVFPTYRSLSWWSYVIEYYKEYIVDPLDRQLIGDQYAVRQLASQRLGGKFQKDDLDAWLRYKPWINAKNEIDYLERVLSGRIPALNFRKFSDAGYLSRYSSIDQVIRQPKDILLAFVVHTSLIATLMANSPKPHLLPSQNTEHFKAKLKVSK